MGLEITCPVGNQRVAYAVSLIERVPGEGFDKVEDFDSQLAVVPLALGAVHEVVALLGHQRGDFLAHRLADDVGRPQGIASELLKDQQYLVLVDDDAVGLVQ